MKLCIFQWWRKMWITFIICRLRIIRPTETWSTSITNHFELYSNILLWTVLYSIFHSTEFLSSFFLLGAFAKTANATISLVISICTFVRPSQWPRGLRRRSKAARLLRLWVRIPPGAWMFVVSVVCCQVEVSATSWSLVQGSPTDCGASLCVIRKPRKQGG